MRTVQSSSHRSLSRSFSLLLALTVVGAAGVTAQFGPPAQQLWTQGHVLGESAETTDLFGSALVSGDWDGDGYDDLAIAAIDEDYDAVSNAGVVHTFYGTWNGLAALGAQTFRQTREGGTDGETDDRFGNVLAKGDFDGDGYDDLVVGAPNEDSSVTDSGSAQVFYGSPLGLSYERTQFLFQGAGTIDNWVAGVPMQGDRFAAALAAGDFNHDGYDDLAVGAPGDRNPKKGGGETSGGGVHLIYGSPSGLSFVGDLLFRRESLTLTVSAYNSSFGASLAAGDFDGDGKTDLAIGDPGHTQNVGSTAFFGCGAVYVVFGGSTGLQLSRYQFFYQGTATSLGLAESNDGFGARLAAGDLNGDGRSDLVVGVPAEDIETIDRAGAINVLYGATGGLTTAGALFLHQASAGVVEEAEAVDYFGNALAIGNVVGGGTADLLVGVELENLTAGAYHLFAGGPTGLTLTGNALRTWTSTAGDRYDVYGAALTLGDFDGNGALDIAVGAPHEDSANASSTGLVQVTYGWAPDVVLP